MLPITNARRDLKATRRADTGEIMGPGAARHGNKSSAVSS